MTYEATICRIKTSKHPNADRLQIADANGYTAIVSLDHKDGDLGIVFPEGGQLSHEFCMANGLYRKDPATGEPLGGYLEESRRVHAIRLRGVESNALWLPMSALAEWLIDCCEGANPVVDSLPTEGESVTEVMGWPLCEKYLTPATRRAMASGDPAKRKKAAAAQALAKHYDTPQLRTAQIPSGCTAIITEKLHGTSGRTGFVQVDQPQSWLVRALNRLPLVNIKPRKEWQVISGTRNCILDPTGAGEKAKGYRQMAHDLIAPNLSRGETWYYEIVGFEDTGKPIMGPHHIGKIGDPKLEKKLRKANGGDTIVYSYGCASDGRIPCDYAPFGKGETPKFKIFIYRITDGGRDLTREELTTRVWAAGEHAGRWIDAVPVLHAVHTDASSSLDVECDILTRGGSIVSSQVPIREGVCISFERGGEVIGKALKHKGFVFCALEGIRKNDPDYVDTEEAA